MIASYLWFCINGGTGLIGVKSFALKVNDCFQGWKVFSTGGKNCGKKLEKTERKKIGMEKTGKN